MPMVFSWCGENSVSASRDDFEGLEVQESSCRPPVEREFILEGETGRTMNWDDEWDEKKHTESFEFKISEFGELFLYEWREESDRWREIWQNRKISWLLQKYLVHYWFWNDNEFIIRL